MKKIKKPIRITDTTLRDAHQSLWATRMRTEDIINIIETIDSVGYYSLEVWGGATFDVCLRYLREDPWERLRQIKSRVKHTPLQMLLRGQNIVGYKNYPDDLVERFIQIAHENGIDIFRVFDALNDMRNLETAVRAIKKTKAHAQGCLTYTTSPVHTIEKYVGEAKILENMGADSLCIKDMAGILTPLSANMLISALCQNTKLPVQIHCHATGGMAIPAYWEGVHAGAGAIDCAISSLAGFSSQPPVETIIAIFNETDYEIKLNIDALQKISKYFTELTPKRAPRKGFQPIVEEGILLHQIPGGMISNFVSQLEQQGMLEKLPETLEELSKVRKDFGYPPLVTPTSQIVGTQAVMNIIYKQRYKVVPQEVKNYIKGMYGRSPAPIDSKLIEKILGKEKPISHRPADELEHILPTATKNIENPKLLHNEEDILSYCLFPEVSVEFFKWRELPENERPKPPADVEMEQYQNNKSEINKTNSSINETNNLSPVLHPADYAAINTILESASKISFNELTIKKGDFNFTVKSDNGINTYAACNESDKAVNTITHAKENAETNDEHTKTKVLTHTDTINAVIAGTLYKSPGAGKPCFVTEGKAVKKGQTVFILEAMKLFNEIQAPYNCRIVKFLVDDGQKVAKDQPVLAVEKI